MTLLKLSDSSETARSGRLFASGILRSAASKSVESLLVGEAKRSTFRGFLSRTRSLFCKRWPNYARAINYANKFKKMLRSKNHKHL